MDIRDRHFGPCISGSTPDGLVSIDAVEFVERLLLFEKYILASVRLKEFPALLRLFGYDGILQLLKSDAISLYCDAVSIAQTGQGLIPGVDSKQLPLNTFRFHIVRIADHKEYVQQAMRALDANAGLSGKRLTKLKLAIADRLIPPRPEDSQKAALQLESDLSNNAPYLRAAVAQAIHRRLNVHVPQTEVRIDLTRFDENVFRASSNLSQLTGASPEEIHKVLESGFLAIGGLNQRLGWMDAHSAVTGFNDGELSIFDNRISFLATQLDPESQRSRFQRVLKLTDFPDVSTAIDEGRLNLERLLEIRTSDECRQFRQWLRATDSASDQEIIDQFNSLKTKLAPYAQGRTGKALRWLASTGIGLIPGAGAILGPLVGLLDTFLVEKLLPKGGPITFISDLYPSIFQDK